MTPEHIAEQIRNVRFTQVTFRQGYDMGKVDDLLDALETAALARATLATVVAAGSPLTTTRFRPAYAIDEVDAFLTSIVA